MQLWELSLLWLVAAGHHDSDKLCQEQPWIPIGQTELNKFYSSTPRDS